ncbi:MAG: 2-oxoacid:acceptor oxidoreductase family protein [Chloroflexota bacterium]
METSVIISGFGGQGALFAGQVMAYAAMDVGKQVTWIPSYGPEMRGGTAHCTVVISDDEIGSPLVRYPSAAVVLNLPSLDKYETLVQSGGVLIANASLIDRKVQRTDIQSVEIPANNLAEELGSRQLTNMVMLGALLNKLPILSFEDIERALEAHLPERHRKLLDPNRQALRKGAEFRG